MELLFIILTAIVTGLIVGLLPGVGSSYIMLTSLPLLYLLPPELCIIYYAVATQSSQFSGSVSAINFGIIGELTSYPALSERNYILQHNLQTTALKFTALGSVLACVVSVLLLYPMLAWFQTQSLIMRTDFIFFITTMIIVFCIFYKKNTPWINMLLIVAGLIISQIGLQSTGFSESKFLTFDQPFLYGGIPMISVLAGLIAVPLITRHRDWQVNSSNIHIHYTKDQLTRFPLLSSLRGNASGMIAGLIPAIGTQLGSNLAWAIEKKLYPNDNHQSVMARLTAAESANNSSQITVLIPLLMLGIAIVPSEMILLSVIETKFWMPGQETWQLYGMGFYQWLTVALTLCSIVCFVACYSLLSWINPWLKSNLNLLNKICILLVLAAVIYSGSLVDAKVFFLACFLFFSVITIVFDKIDFVPLVAGYFVGDVFVNSFVILRFMYL
jgi:putative tricarboxylic transport membrane protein